MASRESCLGSAIATWSLVITAFYSYTIIHKEMTRVPALSTLLIIFVICTTNRSKRNNFREPKLVGLTTFGTDAVTSTSFSLFFEFLETLDFTNNWGAQFSWWNIVWEILGVNCWWTFILNKETKHARDRELIFMSFSIHSGYGKLLRRRKLGNRTQLTPLLSYYWLGVRMGAAITVMLKYVLQHVGRYCDDDDYKPCYARPWDYSGGETWQFFSTKWLIKSFLGFVWIFVLLAQVDWVRLGETHTVQTWRDYQSTTLSPRNSSIQSWTRVSRRSRPVRSTSNPTLTTFSTSFQSGARIESTTSTTSSKSLKPMRTGSLTLRKCEQPINVINWIPGSRRVCWELILNLTHG